MSKQKKETFNMSFYLDREDVRVLKELAQAWGTSRSGVIRILLHRAYAQVCERPADHPLTDGNTHAIIPAKEREE